MSENRYYPERTMIIHEEEQSDWTGLLNHLGEPIMRQRTPFGFRNQE